MRSRIPSSRGAIQAGHRRGRPWLLDRSTSGAGPAPLGESASDRHDGRPSEQGRDPSSRAATSRVTSDSTSLMAGAITRSHTPGRPMPRLIIPAESPAPYRAPGDSCSARRAAGDPRIGKRAGPRCRQRDVALEEHDHASHASARPGRGHTAGPTPALCSAGVSTDRVGWLPWSGGRKRAVGADAAERSARGQR